MSAQLFVVFFGLGAAALAFWTDFRFPKLAPGSARLLLLHLVAATVIPRLMFAGQGALMEDGSPLVGVFLLALPSLVYIMLVAIWGIKLAQRALYRGAM